MQPILIVGIIIFSGFVFGEIASRLKLPKVTGYIFAGIMLNPQTSHLIPHDYVEHTNFITNISLSFITFSVGGTLLFSKIRALGKKIVLITVFEAEFAFLFVFAIIFLAAPFLLRQESMPFYYISLALFLAALASPTDPSATLAVEHEYHAKGEVTSTIMGVAAFDDILGIINYSIAFAIASVFVLDKSLGIKLILNPFFNILSSILLGLAFGAFLNIITKIIQKETEGAFIVVIFSLLSLCYGTASLLGIDELLSTMSMGILVVNFNTKKELIFKILERYTEELIFVLFFTLSAMHLDFSVLMDNYILVILFVVFRALGKYSGTLLGATISKASSQIRKYVSGGLIPQGGIVIGLALVIKQEPSFDGFSDIIISVIIGATIVHEIIGPLFSRLALKKAGEI